MINIKISNEYSPLKTVLLGIAKDIGDPPNQMETYDPRSLYHVKNNSYPSEKGLIKNIDDFYKKFINVI